MRNQTDFWLDIFSTTNTAEFKWGKQQGYKEKTTKNLSIEDSPAFSLNLRIPASLKKTKAFTQSVRANELLFSALEKKLISYTSNRQAW